MKLQGNWKRGSLHTHTNWSDGRGFPEQMVGAYKGLGYDFVCFSDHNIFPVDKNFWLPVRSDEGHWPPMVTWERFKAYQNEYPKCVERRDVSYRPMVRLRTYDEVKPMFEEPGKFLVIGGEEFTGGTQLPEGRFDVHFNILNLEKDIPLPPSGTVEEMIDRYIEAYKKAIDGWPHPTMFMLNHPQWRYWDVSPHQVADLPIVRHFEVCNGGFEYVPADGMPTIGKFWDVVNAFRCAKGQPLMFGTATDDSHFYDERIHDNCGCGNGWVTVHCPGEFTADRVIDAMNRGDYYASNGVELDMVEFVDGKLRVKAAVRDGVKYKITFIGTKRGFNAEWTLRHFDCVQENARPNFNRDLRMYSDDIGQIFQTTDGPEAEYTLSDDDLYVRAIIDSDAPSHVRHDAPGAAPNEKAWTQPYRR